MAARDADRMEVWKWPITTREPHWRSGGRSADILQPATGGVDCSSAWRSLPLNTVQLTNTLRIEAAGRRV